MGILISLNTKKDRRNASTKYIRQVNGGVSLEKTRTLPREAVRETSSHILGTRPIARTRIGGMGILQKGRGVLL